MKNEILLQVNENEKIGVRRWQIVDDGIVKDFDKNRNIVDKQHYAIVTSKGGGSSVSIGELTRDEMIELAFILHRFINE